jgi:hypothetical protein
METPPFAMLVVSPVSKLSDRDRQFDIRRNCGQHKSNTNGTTVNKQAIAVLPRVHEMPMAECWSEGIADFAIVAFGYDG